MIDNFHYNMIKEYKAKEKRYMTIESIISKIDPKSSIELLPGAHPSLKNIDEEVFYIQPTYEEIISKKNSRFLLFSAPGASGKTALAKFIARKKMGLYWDLSQIKLGDNSFHGTLLRAIGADKLAGYFEKINSGKTVLILDAFDEAEMISGRSGIETFLKDLDDITKDSTAPSICLFGRTESAVYIAEYCKEHNINYSHYEISFFEEYNAKKFVMEKVIHDGNSVTDVVEKCINEQFSIIKQLLGKDELAKTFLGYAPVLEALAGAFDKERNTIKLLERLKGESVTSTRIIFDILDELLDREQKKVCNALKEKWTKTYPEFADWADVYSKKEQMVRLVEYIVLEEIEADSYYLNEKIPDELYVDYIDAIKGFLPQHPFLQNIVKRKCIDFSGPAFRDFAVSYVLSVREYEDLALQYFENYMHAFRFPSQLLFDFYVEFSDGIMRGALFPLMYDSYKAKETAGKVAKIDINDDGESIFAVFALDTTSTEMCIAGNDRLLISRLSNSNIDISREVCIGDSYGLPRISNSTIVCDRILMNCKSLGIEARTPGEVVLVSKKEVINERSDIIDIKVVSDKNELVKVSIPNINSFYKLRPYMYNYTEGDVKDFIGFYIFVKKVLSLLRKHKKDVPAKDKEYIDNKIISKSESKKKIMAYLINKEIIFVDHAQSYLYKLHPEKLAEYGLNWATLDDKGTFKKLYDDYMK